MLKKVFAGLLCLTFGLFAMAQKHSALDNNGRLVTFGVNSPESKIKIIFQADSATTFIEPFIFVPNDPLGTAVILRGAKKVTVTTWVRKDSLDYYRYTLIENDSNVIVSNAKLKKVDFVWPAQSDKPGFLSMDFGVPAIAGKKTTLKVWRLPRELEVTTLIIYNKPLPKPEFRGITLMEGGDLARMKRPNRPVLSPLIRNRTFSVSSSTNGFWLQMKRTDLDFVYRVGLRKRGKGNGKIIFAPGSWDYNTLDKHPGFYVNAKMFDEPGDYELFIAPVPVFPDIFYSRRLSGATLIPFSVTRPPITFSGKTLLLTLIGAAALIGLVVALILNRVKKKSRARETASRLQAERAEDELTAIRAQLNPHFVFNSLSAIQGLINQNEVKSANDYLSQFARLTRHVLNDRSLISIGEEISLLEDYLSMEHLRFPFEYHIHCNKEINRYAEIPSMLVQPFVENAVKYAMSVSNGTGKLTLHFRKDDRDLLISIADNGKGFDVDAPRDGLGIRFTRKRLVLFEKVYASCPVTMQLQSGTEGTTVIIKLAYWL